MPVEFSAAAYCLGHSMVRPGYRLNDNDVTLLPIFPIPANVPGVPPGGILQGLTGFEAMAKGRGIDGSASSTLALHAPTAAIRIRSRQQRPT